MATTYEKIQSYTLGSASANITFSSISSAYTDLRLVFTGSYAVASRGSIRFNSDSSTNYSDTRLLGSGTSATSTGNTNQTYQIVGPSDSSAVLLNEIDIFSYAGSTNKTFLIGNSQDNNGSGFVSRWVCLWRSTSAITSIVYATYDGVNLAAGSTATLYGILKAV